MPDIAQKFLKNRKEHDKIAKEWTRTLSTPSPSLSPYSLIVLQSPSSEKYATPVVKKPAAGSSSSKDSDKDKNDKKSKKEVEVLVLD